MNTNFPFAIIIEAAVYLVTIWIALKAKDKAKYAAISYLLYGLTRLSLLLLVFFNLLGIQVSSTLWFFSLVVLFILGIVIYLFKKSSIAITYSTFIMLFLLFGTSQIITGWLPFGYVVYSYLKERTEAKHN